MAKKHIAELNKKEKEQKRDVTVNKSKSKSMYKSLLMLAALPAGDLPNCTRYAMTSLKGIDAPLI